MTQPSATSRQVAQDRQPAGAGTPPPGASEPSPEQPKVPPREDPEASNPLPPGADKDLPEGEYGKAGIVDKPHH
jgi:hypothetical protein